MCIELFGCGFGCLVCFNAFGFRVAGLGCVLFEWFVIVVNSDSGFWVLVWYDLGSWCFDCSVFVDGLW